MWCNWVNIDADQAGVVKVTRLKTLTQFWTLSKCIHPLLFLQFYDTYVTPYIVLCIEPAEQLLLRYITVIDYVTPLHRFRYMLISLLHMNSSPPNFNSLKPGAEHTLLCFYNALRLVSSSHQASGNQLLNQLCQNRHH